MHFYDNLKEGFLPAFSLNWTKIDSTTKNLWITENVLMGKIKETTGPLIQIQNQDIFIRRCI